MMSEFENEKCPQCGLFYDKHVWLKSHFHTSFIKFLESEVEMWKGEKLKPDEENPNPLDREEHSFNVAIDKFTEHLEELIKEIKQ